MTDSKMIVDTLVRFSYSADPGHVCPADEGGHCAAFSAWMCKMSVFPVRGLEIGGQGYFVYFFSPEYADHVLEWWKKRLGSAVAVKPHFISVL